MATVRNSTGRLALLAIAWAAVAACTGGHDPGVVEVRSSDCAVCHLPEFIAAESPPHDGIFPPECALCHTNVAWSPAVFDHVTVSNRECKLCHQADYDGTADPVHAGLYPTTCVNCHGTNAWRPAIAGEHPETAFPIANGAHEGIACTECHDPNRGASTGGMNTNCVGCHTGEHSMNRVNNQHEGVSDYSFNAAQPNFCLTCHPNGRH